MRFLFTSEQVPAKILAKSKKSGASRFYRVRCAQSKSETQQPTDAHGRHLASHGCHAPDARRATAPIARYPHRTAPHAPYRGSPPQIRVACATLKPPRPHQNKRLPPLESERPLPLPLRQGGLAGTGGEGNAAGPAAVPGRGAPPSHRVGARAPRAVRRLPRLGSIKVNFLVEDQSRF
jgi:hypothetical protein